MRREETHQVIDRVEQTSCEAKPMLPFGFVLHHANRVFTRMLDTELRPLGVTSAQLGPLIVMAQNAGPLLQRDLVKLSAIAQPAMVSALNVLSRNGFISQVRHERDRRATVLELTDKGRAVVDRATPILVSCNARAVAGLSAEQESELVRLTAMVISNIEGRRRI